VKELRVNLTETDCHHSRHTQSHTGRRRRFPRSLVGFIEFRRFEFRGDRDDPNPAAAVNSLTGREGWNVEKTIGVSAFENNWRKQLVSVLLEQLVSVLFVVRKMN
jgi:hypothetical protein